MKRSISALPFVLGGSLAWVGACGLQTAGLGGVSGVSTTASSGSTGGAGGAVTSGGAAGGTSVSTGHVASSSSGTGGSCPTGTKLCAGVCASTSNPAFGCEAAACGACASSAHQTPGCDGNGACTTTCDTGFADCDGMASNGCETDTANDPSDCGTCGKACPGPTGQATCTSGACGLTCPAGFADCNANPADGCETSVTTTTHCGTCSKACTNGNGTTACTGGGCTPTCATGFADCNGNPDDGCETPLDATSNCGMCGRVCASGFTCLNENDDPTQPFTCGCGATDANCDNGAPMGSFSCKSLPGPDKCMCGTTLCDFGQRCNSSGKCQ